VSIVLQWLIVVPLVVAAALFAVWRLLSARLRVRMLSWLLMWLPQQAPGPVTRLRAALARRVSLETAGGCAACSKH
jgi:hypothetical protein